MLLRVWYPINVCTISYTIKNIILDALNRTSDDPNGEISFKLNDFGSRGSSSQESAMIGGAAHLVNFQGSDNVVGIRCANNFYYHKMAGFSIPAAEHSSITGWGKDHEVDAYRNMLKQFAKPGALVAIVSDSYDLWNAITNHWGTTLKNEVMQSGAVVIIRPDSGNPPEVVLKSLQLLDEKFGHTVNKKGFKVLNNVRVIQGDGVNEHSIKNVLDTIIKSDYSATNVAFGMGGALLTMHNRDTMKFAMKCSSITVDGFQRDVFKDPITDHGKVSKAGILDLVFRNNEYQTVRDFQTDSVMRVVFENGIILVEDTLDEIRKRTQVG
ncbi:MAG: nicotinate phosphoribosyltransferase [Nitrosotalea sp.]